MAKLAYNYPNLLSSLSSYSLSTEDVTYTHVNAYDGRHSKPVRFTAKSNQTFRAVFPELFTFDCVVVVNHNFTPDGTYSFVYGGAVQDAIHTLTYTVMDTPRNMYLRLAAPVTKAWAGINVHDPTNDNIPQFGELIVGLAVDFVDFFSFGWEKGAAFFNETHRTEFGSKTAYEKYAVRTLRIPYVEVNESCQSQIEGLYTLVRGDLRPFVIIPDTDDPFCLFGRIVNQRGSSNPKFGRWTTGIEFSEESTGITLT